MPYVPASAHTKAGETYVETYLPPNLLEPNSKWLINAAFNLNPLLFSLCSDIVSSHPGPKYEFYSFKKLICDLFVIVSISA